MEPYRYTAQYYETDQMGIIHHANYLHWFESARIDVMNQLGFPYKRLEEIGIVSPVVGIECNYKSMVYFGDTIIIKTKIQKYTGVQMEITYEVLNADTGELKAVGTSRHCFLKNNKIVSLKRTCPELDNAFKEITQK